MKQIAATHFSPAKAKQARRRITSALVVAATVLLGLGLPPSTAQAAANSAPTSCPEILLIGARGSGEGISGNRKDDPYKGLGASVAQFADQIDKRFDEGSVRRLPVTYEAAKAETLYPSKLQAGLFVGSAAAAAGSYKTSNLDKYTASVDQGIRFAQDQLVTFEANCPETFYILAGYSQGAMVMHQVLLRLADAGQTNILSKIVSAVLIADGDRMNRTGAIRVGSAPWAAEGVRSAFSVGERDSTPVPRIAVFDVCVEGDLVCNFSVSRLVKPSVPKTIAAFKKAGKIHTDSYRKKDGPLLSGIAEQIANRWYS